METCIESNRSRNNKGRPTIRREGKLWLESRWVWAKSKGPIPKGMNVLHSCDNGLCINIKHLWLGTKKDNTQDMMEKGRNGHVVFRGAASKLAKLTWDDVDKIRALNAPQRVIAKAFGVSQGTISFILTGVTWKEEFREQPRLTLRPRSP